MPYRLQGQYLSVKMLIFAAGLRLARITLEMSQACLNQNSLEVIGFSFQAIRSEMTIYCCSLLQQAQKMHLSQLFPLISQAKTSAPFLSLSYILQFLMIMTQRLPSGLAATQKSLRLSGTSSMQSVICSIFLQYLLILLFSSCRFFFLEKVLAFDDYSSMTSLQFGLSFCVSWCSHDSSTSSSSSAYIILLVRSKISSLRCLRSRMDNSLILPKS